MHKAKSSHLVVVEIFYLKTQMLILSWDVIRLHPLGTMTIWTQIMRQIHLIVETTYSYGVTSIYYSCTSWPKTSRHTTNWWWRNSCSSSQPRLHSALHPAAGSLHRSVCGRAAVGRETASVSETQRYKLKITSREWQSFKSWIHPLCYLLIPFCHTSIIKDKSQKICMKLNLESHYWKCGFKKGQLLLSF